MRIWIILFMLLLRCATPVCAECHTPIGVPCHEQDCESACHDHEGEGEQHHDHGVPQFGEDASTSAKLFASDISFSAPAPVTFDTNHFSPQNAVQVVSVPPARSRTPFVIRC